MEEGRDLGVRGVADHERTAGSARGSIDGIDEGRDEGGDENAIAHGPSIHRPTDLVRPIGDEAYPGAVSYTHLRAH